MSLFPLVVEVQNNRVSFPTINTRVRFEVIPDKPPLLFSKPPELICRLLRVFLVGGLSTNTTANPAIRLETIWHPSVFSELCLLLINFAPTTLFQTFGG